MSHTCLAGSRWRRWFRGLPLLAGTLLAAPFVAAVDVVRPEVRATYPHDTGAYTEGLTVAGGRLFESTGLWGRSSLREVELTSGSILRSIALVDSEFGEGIAYDDGRLIMLTFDSGVAHVHDARSLDPLNDFFYEGQGWGLCNDGSRLLMTNGTGLIQIRERATFALLETMTVTEDSVPFSGALNEIECFDGKVLANVWPTFDIVVIGADTGEVLRRVDAYGLLSAEEELSSGELNGIAFDRDAGKLYLTGKLWPKLFEVSIPGVTSTENQSGCAMGAAQTRSLGPLIMLVMLVMLLAHARLWSRRSDVTARPSGAALGCAGVFRTACFRKNIKRPPQQSRVEGCAPHWLE